MSKNYTYLIHGRLNDEKKLAWWMLKSHRTPYQMTEWAKFDTSRWPKYLSPTTKEIILLDCNGQFKGFRFYSNYREVPYKDNRPTRVKKSRLTMIVLQSREL